MAKDRGLCEAASVALRLAKTVVKGSVPGGEPSRTPGEGLEYVDFRDYEPGDDVRYIDWRLTARMLGPDGSNRVIVKVFRAERSVRTVLVVDLSESMLFGSKALAGLYTAFLVLETAHLLRDRVSLAIVARGRVRRSPYTQPRLAAEMLRVLACREGGGGAGGLDMVTQLIASIPRRSPVVVVTDYAHSLEELRSLLRYASARSCRVAMYTVLDPAEVAPPVDRGYALFTDPESGVAVPAELGEFYAASRLHVSRIRTVVRLLGAIHVDALWSRGLQNPYRVIDAYLRARHGA